MKQSPQHQSIQDDLEALLSQHSEPQTVPVLLRELLRRLLDEPTTQRLRLAASRFLRVLQEEN